MKEQLIELAKEKGFKTNVFSEAEITSDLNYYLWMCELQKWLRDEYGINILVCTKATYLAWFYKVNGFWNSNTSHTYEQALEQGLINGLKLIK